MQVPARCVGFPTRVRLSIGQPGVALSREVGPAWVAGAPGSDEERAVCRLAAVLQVGVEVAGDAAGEVVAFVREFATWPAITPR